MYYRRPRLISLVRCEMTQAGDRQIPELGPKTPLNVSNPVPPVPGRSDILRPIAVLVQAAAPVHYAGTGNVVAVIEKPIELVGVQQIACERNDQAVGRDPERPIVNPFGARFFDGCGEPCQMIGKHE